MVIPIGTASEPEFSTLLMMISPLSYRKEVLFIHFLVFTDLGVPLTPCYLAPLVLYTPPYFRLPTYLHKKQYIEVLPVNYECC